MTDLTSLDTLETPAAVVDLDRMERNLDTAASYAAEHGLALRPHVKTHKSPRIASAQLARGAAGLTCATPFEAEVMATVSDDLLLAYPPVGAARAERIAALPANVRVTVALDSVQAVDEIGHAARFIGRPPRKMPGHTRNSKGVRATGRAITPPAARAPAPPPASSSPRRRRARRRPDR